MTLAARPVGASSVVRCRKKHGAYERSDDRCFAGSGIASQDKNGGGVPIEDKSGERENESPLFVGGRERQEGRNLITKEIGQHALRKENVETKIKNSKERVV